MQPITRLTALAISFAVLAINANNAYALKTDTQQPLNVQSKEQLADLQANKLFFIGDVVATQGTIEVHCDKAELTRNEKNELKEVMTWGQPVTFRQELDDGKILRSQSSTLQYLPLTGDIVLTGNATVWQGESHVSGEKIVYNTVSQKMKANTANNQNGRVKSTFIPQEFQGNDKNQSNSKK